MELRKLVSEDQNYHLSQAETAQSLLTEVDSQTLRSAIQHLPRRTGERETETARQAAATGKVIRLIPNLLQRFYHIATGSNREPNKLLSSCIAGCKSLLVRAHYASCAIAHARVFGPWTDATRACEQHLQTKEATIAVHVLLQGARINPQLWITGSSSDVRSECGAPLAQLLLLSAVRDRVLCFLAQPPGYAVSSARDSEAATELQQLPNPRARELLAQHARKVRPRPLARPNSRFPNLIVCPACARSSSCCWRSRGCRREAASITWTTEGSPAR
jgi:hypothetical protein